MNDKNIDSETEDVLNLLLFVITADSKILKEEIESFRTVAAELNLSDRQGIALSDQWVSNWFEKNSEAVRQESGRPEADSKLVHLFIRLQKWPNKIKLLDALCHVAASDGQFHINEKVLITLAAAYWDINSPQMN